MTTNKTNLKKKIFNYILDAVDADGYGLELNTPKEKVDFIHETFKREYAHNIKYYGGEYRAFPEWLAGLPSCFNIEYRTHFILELAKNWGSIPAGATERQQEKIVSNWYNFVSVNFFQLLRKLETKETLSEAYN
jgi:hypothetical protein